MNSFKKLRHTSAHKQSRRGYTDRVISDGDYFVTNQKPIFLAVYKEITGRWQKFDRILPKDYPWKLGGKGAWLGVHGFNRHPRNLQKPNK